MLRPMRYGSMTVNDNMDGYGRNGSWYCTNIRLDEREKMTTNLTRKNQPLAGIWNTCPLSPETRIRRAAPT